MQGNRKNRFASLASFASFATAAAIVATGLVVSGHSMGQQGAMMNPGLVGRDQTEAIRINEAIFQATGFGNTTMVATPAGNVIIDTLSLIHI